MTWFYAQSGRQAGPIDESELDRLIREGIVGQSTLVWREGMANWQPLSEVRPTPSLPPIPNLEPSGLPAGHVICSECRKLVFAGETVQIGSATVCAACKPIYLQKLREGTVSFSVQPRAIRYAGFWIRAGAKVIDGLIMAIILLPVSFLFGFRMVINPTLNNMPELTGMLAQIGIQTAIGIVVRLLYTWLLVGRYGATLGKMLVGIKIVTSDGQPITYKHAFGRYWAEIVTQFTCYIGYIIAAFDDEKRTLHDRMCNTRVVYK